MNVPQQIVEERDARIYEARKGGMNFRQIGQALKIAPSTAHAGYMREMRRRSKMSAAAAHDEVWLTLDQLDQLLANLWPITRPHKITHQDANGDDIEIEVPANMDAIDRVMKIIAQKSKILGLEKDIISIESGGQSGISVGGNEETTELTPEAEGRQFALELMKHGVLAGAEIDQIQAIIARSESKEHADIEDAEVIEDSNDRLALTVGNPFAEPPPFEDDEDDAFAPGWWVPEEMEDGDSATRDREE